jgi:hypothetical protein
MRHDTDGLYRHSCGKMVYAATNLSQGESPVIRHYFVGRDDSQRGGNHAIFRARCSDPPWFVSFRQNGVG